MRYIWLLCAPALQKMLDARLPKAEWDALSAVEALENIIKLVLHAANQAVQWSDFFYVKQAVGMSVADYFTKSSQMVLDCAFQCPSCDKDLIQKHLRAYCVAFEAAQRNAHRFLLNHHTKATTSDITHDAVSDDDVIAATSPRKARHRTCGYCSDRHQPGKTACPTANAMCRACGKLGHFQKVCRGGKNPTRKDAVASAVMATT
ncbi:hypothetical protein E2C01_026899 [Portunus trituberculatus]|uniref:CCHC-type domain-containing protein n=1 Tax=Portunus trituberculatus TaxID=210409 RepID=A0A5B7EMA6_PORTR|nr:hypothetical protein [Portunus trituberculatus]